MNFFYISIVKLNFPRAPKIMRKASQISNSTYKFDLYVYWFVSNKRQTAKPIRKTFFMTTCMTLEKLFGKGYN